jgi:hypothetical protein
MVNAGLPEREAVKVTGHRTGAVFDRHHIVSPADLQDVARSSRAQFTGTGRARAVSGGAGHLTPVSQPCKFAARSTDAAA